MYLENNNGPTLPLDGLWQFRLGHAPEVDLPVPSAWEAHTADKLTDGPAFYRRKFDLPVSWLGSRILLEADAISFEATIRVNDQLAGTHRGMWSPFQLDITALVHEGENVIEIEAWKPGERFPLRETLAGFLPDVATTFGGLWQSIRLRALSLAALGDLRVFAYGGGWLDVQGQIVGLGERRATEVASAAADGAARRD
ncbi:MAG: sugar-binding domain-containing protein, partial [Chloroflexota bacterium]